MTKESNTNTMWPDRKCNIGDCPAFHLTGQDWEDIEKSNKEAIRHGVKKAIEKYGMPSGTCQITGLDRIVNSPCNVRDDDFLDHFQRKYGMR